MTTFEGFGHAKVILLGEHAVVHGHPALAAAIDRGFRAEARLGIEPLLEIPAWQVSVRPGDEDPLARALEVLLAAAPEQVRRASILVEPRVPSRAGLGSSAAMSVAIARALSGLSGRAASDDEIEAWAGRAEEVFHGAGRASGVDAAVACRGGTLRFVRGEPPRQVSFARPLSVVVAQIEPRASTKAMVEQVSGALEREPRRVRGIFDEIGALVDDAVDAASAGDAEGLGRLFDDNHRLLGELGLSTPGLERGCELARNAGALGAKLTGAGGGGCMVALSPGCENAVRAALEAHASWVAATPLGGG